MTNAETFSHVRRWLDEISRYCDERIVKILVGNKDDLGCVDKKVPTDDAKQYAREMNVNFYETSAKDGKNVDMVFHTVARLALRQRLDERQRTELSQGSDPTQRSKSRKSIRLKKSKKKTRSCCK